MEIEEKGVVFYVGGQPDILAHDFEGVMGGAGTRGLELGQKAQACLIMHHLEVLKIASTLEERPMLCFHLQPDQLVRMRFGLQGLGYLEFVYTTTWVVRNIKPERVISFQLKPVLKVRWPLSFLAKQKLNPECIGRLDITENGGFEITVHNTQSKGCCSLSIELSCDDRL